MKEHINAMLIESRLQYVQDDGWGILTLATQVCMFLLAKDGIVWVKASSFIDVSAIEYFTSQSFN